MSFSLFSLLPSSPADELAGNLDGVYALAIETSGRVGSVALVRDGLVLAEPTFEHGLKHAAGILPMIDRLCRQQSIAPNEISELYLSIGPGSFTGLRIGVTLAKTMALASGVKLVAVPTVEVLVRNAPPDAVDAIIVLDAKRDQIFTAAFTRAASTKTSDWIEREPAHLDTLAAMLARAPRPVHLIGEGLPFHDKFIDPADRGIICSPADEWRARASVVAAIGMTMATAGQYAEPDRLTPLYLRKAEAEEKWDAAHAKPDKAAVVNP